MSFLPYLFLFKFYLFNRCSAHFISSWSIIEVRFFFLLFFFYLLHCLCFWIQYFVIAKFISICSTEERSFRNKSSILSFLIKYATKLRFCTIYRSFHSNFTWSLVDIFLLFSLFCYLLLYL